MASAPAELPAGSWAGILEALEAAPPLSRAVGGGRPVRFLATQMRLAGGDHAGAQRNFSGWASTVNRRASLQVLFCERFWPDGRGEPRVQRHHIVAGGSPGPGVMLRDPAVLRARYGLCAGLSPVVFLLRWRRRSASHEAAAKTGAAIPARSAAPVNALSRNRPPTRATP